MEEIKQLYVKLDPVKDADIIAFLQGKPRTYVVKEALRAFIGNGPTAPAPEVPKTQPTVDVKKKNDNNPFGAMNIAPKA